MITEAKISLRKALDDYYCPPRVIEKTTYSRYVSDCNRWEKHTLNPDVRAIDTALILDFRRKLLAEKLSVNTINPGLKTIHCILLACVKARIIAEVPEFGVPLQQVNPTPAPVPFADLEAILDHTHVAQWPLDQGYWRRFIGFVYLTGLRRGDLREVRREHCSRHKIEFEASKTSKTHIFPMPAWLWRLIEPEPPGRLFPVNPKQIYQELKRIATAASVDYISPKKLRILSVNEWETAHAGCGAVIQGGSIPGWSKATGNYMTTHGLLFRGIDKLKVPRSLLTPEERDREQSDRLKWIQAFERLPASARNHLLGITETMIQ